MYKKGQINAAVLVAIIAGLIIIYILFLPTEDRLDLLGENESGSSGSGVSVKGESILLLEHPGRLDTVKKIDDRLIPNIYLVEAVNAKEIDRINPFSVRNGWFDKKERSVRFRLDDLEDTDNVLLSFSLKKNQGILTIKLNDEVIYEYAPKQLNIVVRLEKVLLENDNVLEFSVSPVGISFWKTNQYDLESVVIVGDITDRSRQESRNIFELTDSEFMNLESSKLRFVPYCSRVIDVGTLTVLVNNRNVYSAVPVCDDPVRPIPILGALSAGENKIVFSTTKGSYSIEQIKVDLDLKETKTIAYYFELSDEQFDDVVDDIKDVNVTIEFVDNDKNKRATLSVNGHRVTIDQDEPVYGRNIDDWVERDNNYIEIIPKTTLDIVDLKVALYD